MKPTKFAGAVSAAYGKEIKEYGLGFDSVDFSGQYEAYETFDEAKSANDLLSNEEHLNAINAKRKAAARAKATTDALTSAGINKPDPNSPEVLTDIMVKNLIKQTGVAEDVARSMVEGMLASAKK